MQFRAKRSELIKGLSIAFGAVPQKSTIEILKNVFMDVSAARVDITGTDLDITARTWLPIEYDGAAMFTFCAPRLLLDICKELGDETIEFEFSNSKLKLKSATGVYHIPTVDSADFPMINFVKDKIFDVPGQWLQTVARKTLFAVGQDEYRPVLTGVSFNYSDARMNVVATDGHRLAKWLDKRFIEVKPFSAIVPDKALNIAARTFVESEVVGAFLNDGKIMFEGDRTSIIAKLIEGTYPDIERVWPKNNDKVLAVNRAVLASALRRIGVFSDETTHQVVLEMKENQVSVHGMNDKDGREAVERMDCNFAGSYFAVGLNNQYLQEILKAMDSEWVTFLFGTSDEAVLIEGDADNYTVLQMPIRLHDEEVGTDVADENESEVENG